MTKWCLEVEDSNDEQNTIEIAGEDPVFDARLVWEDNYKKRIKKNTRSKRIPKAKIYKQFNILETNIQSQINQDKFQTNF